MDARQKSAIINRGILRIELRIRFLMEQIKQGAGWLRSTDNYHFLYEEVFDKVQSLQMNLEEELKDYKDMVNAWTGHYKFYLSIRTMQSLTKDEFPEPYRFTLEDLFYTEDIQQEGSDEEEKHPDN